MTRPTTYQRSLAPCSQSPGPRTSKSTPPNSPPSQHSSPAHAEPKPRADLTHILRTTPKPPTISEYRKLADTPVDHDVLTTVGLWLAKTVAA